MIFIQNKYTTLYYKIIARARTRTLPKTTYKERHHIIPKSLGGLNGEENLVLLTGREHLVCHLLLIRMTEHECKASMIHAAWLMANLENKNQQRTKLHARQYSFLREQFAKTHSERMRLNNPMHDPATRKVYDAAILKRGKTPGMTGKRQSVESNMRRSATNRGQFVPLEKRRQASEFHSNRPPEMKIMYAQVHSSNISCIFCRTLTNPGTFRRWHGDNCKAKLH